MSRGKYRRRDVKVKAVDVITDAPLDQTQKSLIRSRFQRIGPLKQQCLHCHKVVKNDHLKRLASHFVKCKETDPADLNRFRSAAATSPNNISADLEERLPIQFNPLPDVPDVFDIAFLDGGWLTGNYFQHNAESIISFDLERPH